MKARHTPRILELGKDFYDPVQAAVFPELKPRFLNQLAADKLGIEGLSSDREWMEKCGLFQPWEANLQEPLALRYHGHQFRHYNPDLGDGRGFLYAQFTDESGKLFDLGTKGSGQTPYSRSGDGRLTLKGAYREALATELLESLGVNTSKTFCFFETGESLERNDEPSPTRAAVLTRLSHGHIRIGTFQRLAYLNEAENIKKLLNYCCKYYYPELMKSHTESSVELAEKFLQAVSENLARLTAQYMIAGFVHGVLNSDNMNISGESFDYGPYRFLPKYDPHFTAAYFDRNGLYSFGRQPQAIFWNVNQLAHSLLKAFPELKAKEHLESFGKVFSDETLKLFFRRLNLKQSETEKDEELLKLYFTFLEENKDCLYEQTFFDLHSGNLERLEKSPQKKSYETESFQKLKNLMTEFEIFDFKKAEHVYFKQEKPCTLLIDEIESIWKEISEKDDWSKFEMKIDQIRQMRGAYS